MPNLYANVNDIRAALPDGLRPAVIKYDALLVRLCTEISRYVDTHCKRVFYPAYETLYYSGIGTVGLWIDDFTSIESVAVSYDDGATYEPLGAGDWVPSAGGSWNGKGAYTRLMVNRTSTALYAWPCGQRSVRVVGWTGWADDRVACWEQVDALTSNPLSAGATSMTVGDVDGLDAWGAPRLGAGTLARLDDELVECTMSMNTGTNTIGILRGRNGTASASHAQGTAVRVWRAPDPVRQAVVTEVIRHMERAFQGFGDGRAQPDIGQMYWTKAVDPSTLKRLETYIKLEAA